MHESQRHTLILDTVNRMSFASTQQLVSKTGSSESTIRRDISDLDNKNLLKRVRGGAQSTDPSKKPRILGRTFARNIERNMPQKTAIARAAADICVDGSSIILSGGTTVFQMGPALVDKTLQILTNSFQLADFLLTESNSTITIPGGIIYREQNILLSPYADQQSERFNAQQMFMGAAAITKSGVLEPDPLITQSVQRLISCADELIICADSSKFSKSATLVLASLEEVGKIITDSEITDAQASLFEECGVEVVIAHQGNAKEEAA